MLKNLPNFIKNINLQICETQQTSKRINSKRSKSVNFSSQTMTRAKHRVNFESSKTKVIHMYVKLE
jgi:hypothetical protein